MSHMTEEAKATDGEATDMPDSTQLLDSRNPLLVMAGLFRERDKKAVDDFNAYCSYHGVTIEARLSFVEARLIDVASLLALALEKISEIESNANQATL